MEKLLPPVIAHGITIVSGLALGIDGYAQKLAIKYGGKTLSVMAGGLDTIYPASNTALGNEIVKNHLMISEYPDGTPYRKYHFPIRNRLISGLCRATIIMEACEKSGSLITAYQALEQNREVLAVPGSILHPNAFGCNKLISRGAKLVQSSEDILEIFGFDVKTLQKKTQKRATPDQQSILALLKKNVYSANMIAEILKLPMQRINVTLIQMELLGMIQKTDTIHYGLI